jgi:hypothetical protein
MKGRIPGKELKTVHSRFEPGTGTMMIGTDETYQGLPVLKSPKTGKRYLLKASEKDRVISRRESERPGGLVEDEVLTLPAPCDYCGSTLGCKVNEMQGGHADNNDGGIDPGRVIIYRCTNGHVFRYGGR